MRIRNQLQYIYYLNYLKLLILYTERATHMRIFNIVCHLKTKTFASIKMSICLALFHYSSGSRPLNSLKFDTVHATLWLRFSWVSSDHCARELPRPLCRRIILELRFQFIYRTIREHFTLFQLLLWLTFVVARHCLAGRPADQLRSTEDDWGTTGGLLGQHCAELCVYQMSIKLRLPERCPPAAPVASLQLAPHSPLPVALNVRSPRCSFFPFYGYGLVVRQIQRLRCSTHPPHSPYPVCNFSLCKPFFLRCLYKLGVAGNHKIRSSCRSLNFIAPCWAFDCF